MEKKEFLYLVNIKGDLRYFAKNVPLTSNIKYFEPSDETQIEVLTDKNYFEDGIKNHYFRINDGIKENQKLSKSPQITVEKIKLLF